MIARLASVVAKLQLEKQTEMDSVQLEEYRKRMQARFQNREPPSSPPQPIPMQAPPSNPPHSQQGHETDDERLAREMQAQEDARVRYAESDEEYARKLQAESEPE